MKKELNETEMSNKYLTEILNKSIGFLLQDFIKIILSDFTSVKNIIQIALKQKNQRKPEAITKKKGFIYLHL